MSENQELQAARQAVADHMKSSCAACSEEARVIKLRANGITRRDVDAPLVGTRCRTEAALRGVVTRLLKAAQTEMFPVEQQSEREAPRDRTYNGDH